MDPGASLHILHDLQILHILYLRELLLLQRTRCSGGPIFNDSSDSCNKLFQAVNSFTNMLYGYHLKDGVVVISDWFLQCTVCTTDFKPSFMIVCSALEVYRVLLSFLLFRICCFIFILNFLKICAGHFCNWYPFALFPSFWIKVGSITDQHNINSCQTRLQN